MPDYSLAEIAEHDKEGDIWILVGQDVYDISDFLPKHPGGPAPLRYAGKDASKIFGRVHRAGTLEKIGKQFKIGELSWQDSAERSTTLAGFTEGLSDVVFAAGDGTQGRNSEMWDPSAPNVGYDVEMDEDGYDLRLGGEDDREFGDKMAKEGEMSHISTIILIMYGSLGSYSWLTAFVTGCSIFVIPAYYVLGMAAFYGWHRMAHSEWYYSVCKRAGFNYLAELHEIHMEHHLESYPPSDFYGSAQLFSEMYPHGKPTISDLIHINRMGHVMDHTSVGALAKSKKKHSPLAHEWPLMLALVVILSGGVLAGGTSAFTIVFVFFFYLVLALVGNALHVSFHVRNFHLEKYEWYLELRTLHYIHHLGDMKSNFAMLNLGMDGFFRSLATTEPSSSRNRKPRATGFYSDLMEGKKDTDLPEGISRASVMRASLYAGASALMLGFDVPVDVQDKKLARTRRGTAVRRATVKNGKAGKAGLQEHHGFPTVLLRLVLLGSALYMWNSSRGVEFMETASTDAYESLDKFHALDTVVEKAPQVDIGRQRSLVQDAQNRLNLLRSELEAFASEFEAKLQALKALELEIAEAREREAALEAQAKAAAELGALEAAVEAQAKAADEVAKVAAAEDSTVELSDAAEAHSPPAAELQPSQGILPPAPEGVDATSRVLDPGHKLFSGLRSWLLAGDGARAVVACTTSAALSEVIILVIIVISCAGPTFRPCLSLILLFLFRTALEFAGTELMVRPAPGAAAGWPLLAGYPCLFVKRGPAANEFFSARIAVAGSACSELLMHAIFQHNHWGTIQKASPATRAAAAFATAALLATQVSLSLAMQVSWTVDVIIALVCTRFCSMVAYQLAPHVDAFMPSS